MAQVELKQCNTCRRVKAVTEFYRDRQNKNGLRNICKECRATYRANNREEKATYDRDYHAEHREEKATYQRDWAKRNPEKINANNRRRDARKRGATTNGKIDYGAIKERDRMICCICGLRVSKKDLSFDHTVPLSLGGPHIQNNLRVCHLRCNSSRGAGRLPVQMVLV